MSDKNNGRRSVRMAGWAGAIMIAAGLFFLRLEQRLHAQGVVYAQDERNIYAPSDAVIDRLSVTLGQNVHKGEMLAVLDNADLRTRALQLNQEIADMKSELAQRNVDMLATNVLPELEQEKLRLDKLRLARKIDLAESESLLLARRLENLIITSPMDGRVVALEYRYAGMAVPQGALLAKVATMDGHYRVRALAPERNIDLVKPGTVAYMKSGVFNAMLEGYVMGKVTRVAPEAQTAPATRYEIYIDVDRSPYPLTLGSTMDVELRLGKRAIWSMLSSSTLRQRDQ